MRKSYLPNDLKTLDTIRLVELMEVMTTKIEPTYAGRPLDLLWFLAEHDRIFVSETFQPLVSWFVHDYRVTSGATWPYSQNANDKSNSKDLIILLL